MTALITLMILALIALTVVSAINAAQEKERDRRLQQRKWRIKADMLTDIVNCLEQTIPNRRIAKYINDEVTLILLQILTLEKASSPHIESSIRHAQLRTEDLSNSDINTLSSYQKDSDAHISQTQVHLTETVEIVRHLAAINKINDSELASFLTELSWAQLMVNAASFIGQGQKFIAMGDRLLAQGYFQRAQQVLMESVHPDPRRIRMIKELSEMLDGNRKSMSRDLLPERKLLSAS
jgi:ABC-type multidrug transport system fused ATPase/permease subunit